MTPLVEVAEKSVGPSYKLPCFSGFQSVKDNEKQLKEMTGVGGQVFSVLLSVISERRFSAGMCKEDMS